MPAIETPFDVSRHHIHLEISVINSQGVEYSVDAILDTGAPVTEFSDLFLHFTGFIDSYSETIEIGSGLQSHKYDKIVLPRVKFCGHLIDEYEVYVSKFEETWGIDCLVGLDFFRNFVVC